jgi:uncharacterized membrane protein
MWYELQLSVKIYRFWLKIRDSLWFLPTIIVGFSILLALGLVELGGYLSDDFLRRWPRLFGAGAEGSRSMLGAIATSMITVAGVIFSITVVVLSLASNQYSPRILHNFMQDRFNQAILGTFLGIFTYCLIVLRTIRGGDLPFVPHLAVQGSVVLALVGVGVLIAFIHHVIFSIQAESIIAGAAFETRQSLKNLFPQELGQELRKEDQAPNLEELEWTIIPSKISGYLQRVDGVRLLAIAEKHHCIFRMEKMVGEFCVEGEPLLAHSGSLKELDVEEVSGLFILSRNRTMSQDISFGIQQIIDIALKALSPGVNETTTALTCVHYLTSICSELSTRQIEADLRTKNGDLRVIAKGPTFALLLHQSFDEIRRNAHQSVAVISSLLVSLETIAMFVNQKDRHDSLWQQFEAISEMANTHLPSDRDRMLIEDLLSRVRHSLIQYANRK